VCISCRPRVDVRKGEGSGPCERMWTGEGGVKNVIFFVDVINGWPLIVEVVFPFTMYVSM